MPPPAPATVPKLLYWRIWLFAIVIVTVPGPESGSLEPAPSSEPELARATAKSPIWLLVIVPVSDLRPGS